MSRPTINTVHVNQPLTNISIAYRNAAYIYPQIFPIVGVSKKSDDYFIFDRSSFFRNRTGMRAPGTRAPMADYGVSTASYLCINDSLGHLIPDEVRDNADAPLRPDVTGTNFVTDGLELAQEIRVATVVTACANWASASNPGTAWSSDTSDPFADIDTLVDAVAKQIGRRPNIAVTSWNVWKRLRNHPDFLERIKYTRPGGRVQTNDLTDWFGFEKVLVGETIYDTAQEGQSASMTYIWGNHFWVGYVTSAPALEEPTAGYVFRWGNKQISRFRLDPEHADLLEGQWFVDTKVCASLAGAGMFTVF